MVALAGARGHGGHGVSGITVVNTILAEGSSQVEDRDGRGDFRRLGEATMKWGLRAGPVG